MKHGCFTSPFLVVLLSLSAGCQQKQVKSKSIGSPGVYWLFESTSSDPHEGSSDRKEAFLRMAASKTCLQPYDRAAQSHYVLTITRSVLDGLHAEIVGGSRDQSLNDHEKQCLQQIWAPPPWQGREFFLKIEPAPFEGAHFLRFSLPTKGTRLIQK